MNTIKNYLLIAVVFSTLASTNILLGTKTQQLESEKTEAKQKKNGEAIYTKDEIKGLAAKNVAHKLEREYKVDFVAEGTKNPKSTKWGLEREKARGKQDIEKGVVTRSADEFAYRFDDSIKPPAEATAKQILKAGGVGGVAGYLIASEDKDFGLKHGVSAPSSTAISAYTCESVETISLLI